MVTVRSIIVEALSRSNLVSRRQSAPADMVESALRLLKGIAAKFGNDNLLQFLVAECSHVLDKKEFVLGEVDPEYPDEYLPVDMDAPKIQKVVKMYWRTTEPIGLGSYVELDFASPGDFDAYPEGSSVYTAQPVNDLQVVVKTKLLADNRTEIKVVYNRKWTIDLDDELRIPEEYVELFTVALTHKLALAFPRLSTEQVKLLKDDLDDMISNVRTSTRARKYVSRRPGIPGVNRAAFINGTMFLPG